MAAGAGGAGGGAVATAAAAGVGAGGAADALGKRKGGPRALSNKQLDAIRDAFPDPLAASQNSDKLAADAMALVKTHASFLVGKGKAKSAPSEQEVCTKLSAVLSRVAGAAPKGWGQRVSRVPNSGGAAAGGAGPGAGTQPDSLSQIPSQYVEQSD